MEEKEIPVNYNFLGNAVKNIATPTENGDAVNKGYVDSLSGVGSYTHTQGVANTTWNISHGLNKLYPNITVVDSAGDEIAGGNIDPIDSNNLTITFGYSFAGVAYLT